ncbi:MAG: hypothetical protein JSS02_31055 [Planctomycetes bacterium]|nr:hypothetical protein [Planctomycetota bacterium]
MSTIAQELAAKLQTLDGPTAIALERVVRDAIDLASRETAPLAEWPVGFFDQIRDAWGDEPFERPQQGELEVREDW